MKRRRIMISGAAALAVCGISGVVPAAVQASSVSAVTWTQQHPAASPPARSQASMAYDAATGTVLLFGGTDTGQGGDNDTWTWNGTTWTQQHPAASPPARFELDSMAYDAATGTVVLFGGVGSSSHGFIKGTWTWDGTTWTQQHPATIPRGNYPVTAYDATTGTVVLFDVATTDRGGDTDTWTWNGTTWTKQTHANNPPTGTSNGTMAYDAATGTVLLFGGTGRPPAFFLADTWTWNGTRWTQQHPATSPAGRTRASMAYDAATGTVLLFGGFDGGELGDTWTWG